MARQFNWAWQSGQRLIVALNDSILSSMILFLTTFKAYVNSFRIQKKCTASTFESLLHFLLKRFQKGEKMSDKAILEILVNIPYNV